MKEHFDFWSVFVIVVTFVLFAFAAFTKGLTHDLLLEGAVFLISVKLILVTYKISVHSRKLERDLAQIKEILIGK